MDSLPAGREEVRAGPGTWGMSLPSSEVATQRSVWSSHWGHRQSNRPGPAQHRHPGRRPPKDTNASKTQHWPPPEPGSPATHLSETVPIPESNSLIFWPVFATVTWVEQDASELRSRLQVIRRPRADRARSLVPPGDGHPWGLVNRRGGAGCWRHRTNVVRSWTRVRERVLATAPKRHRMTEEPWTWAAGGGQRCCPHPPYAHGVWTAESTRRSSTLAGPSGAELPQMEGCRASPAFSLCAHWGLPRSLLPL